MPSAPRLREVRCCAPAPRRDAGALGAQWLARTASVIEGDGAHPTWHAASAVMMNCLLMRLRQRDAVGTLPLIRANASRSFCTATAFCSGVRMIWRDKTTAIVPVGFSQEGVDRHAEALLHVFDRDRQVRPDLRRALHAKRRDRVTDEAAGLHEPRRRDRSSSRLRPSVPLAFADLCAAHPPGTPPA